MSVKVGIIMGSDSDLPVMSKAAEILDELQVPYELTIVIHTDTCCLHAAMLHGKQSVIY